MLVLIVIVKMRFNLLHWKAESLLHVLNFRECIMTHAGSEYWHLIKTPTEQTQNQIQSENTTFQDL